MSHDALTPLPAYVGALAKNLLFEITSCFHGEADYASRQRMYKRKTGWQSQPAYFNPGNDLLSHAVAHAVPSTLEGLTAVFGMGTGVTPPV